MPQVPKYPHRAYLAVAHLLFLGLFILAYVHTMPRVVHVDSAFQIFKWIHGDGVGVEAHRFTAIIPQLLVKAGSICGLPLKVLLVLASMAHVLVPYVIFIILAYPARKPWLAVALALTQVLCTRLTFYGIVLEANYLLSYPFLLFALLDPSDEARPGWSRGPLRWAALFLVLMVHPVGAVVALFVLAFQWVRQRGMRRTIHPMLASTLIWPFLSRVLFPPTGYEASLYRAGRDGIAQLAGGSDLPLVRYLLDHTWNYTSQYLGFWCVLAALAIFMLRRRAWLELSLVLVSIVAYMVLNAATYHEGETAMMMEKNLLPLALFAALPFVLEVERLAPKFQWMLFVPFILLVFLQFRGISFASRPANERLAHIRSLVEQCRKEQVRKACVDSGTLDAAGLHIHWALAFETLLLSSVEGPEQSVSVISSPHCPPSTLGADLGGLIEESDLCGNGTSFFRLPAGAYTQIIVR